MVRRAEIVDSMTVVALLTAAMIRSGESGYELLRPGERPSSVEEMGV